MEGALYNRTLQVSFYPVLYQLSQFYPKRKKKKRKRGSAMRFIVLYLVLLMTLCSCICSLGLDELIILFSLFIFVRTCEVLF